MRLAGKEAFGRQGYATAIRVDTGYNSAAPISGHCGRRICGTPSDPVRNQKAYRFCLLIVAVKPASPAQEVSRVLRSQAQWRVRPQASPAQQAFPERLLAE